MNILIVTQVVDSQDSNLGFFHRWIEEFAKRCDTVTVICLREGDHVLPSNVRVLSLGKEVGSSRTKRVYLFLKYIFEYRDDYDTVFVHMNPEYVLLGGFFWRRWHKKTALWYAHRSLTTKLTRAVPMLDRVFSVTENSFPIRTPKLKGLGHGIDTDLFTPAIHQESTETRIITTGRIAESKHVVEMLETLDVLYRRGEKFSFTVVGVATSPAEEQYAKRLSAEIEKRHYQDKLHFLGSIPHHRLPEILRQHDLFFNFGGTGNMDKAGLEALACGIPMLTTNSSFEDMLSPYGLYVPTMEGEKVADAIVAYLRRPDHSAVIATLRNKVVTEHSLNNLIPKILAELQ